MVTRETSYIGQLYFGLSSDDPAEVAEWHNGDRILLMDQDQMYVYDEAAVTFHEIPMGGGGGGGTCPGPVIKGTGTYTVTSNINSYIDIPISATLNEVGYAAISVMPPDSLVKTSCSAAWSTFRLSAYGFSVEDRAKMTSGIPRIMHIYNGDGTLLQAATTINLGTYCILADDYFNPTSVTIRPYSSTYTIKPATYNWYVWGWE